MEVKGKRILVVGFGASGQAAAELLVQKGATVLAIDESKEKTMKRRARRKKMHGMQIQFGVKSAPTARFDAAILSPGLHPQRGLGLSVSNLDIPIYGELELGSWFCQCPIIAITGTNGKTTTTELIEKVIKANRKKTMTAGNIGLPITAAVSKTEKLDYLTVEVSSFQLETIQSFRPMVSVLMNITPDHLDRYSSMDFYATAKAAIWKNQCGDDVAVVNIDTERLLAKLGHTSPVRTIRYSIKGEATDLWFDGESIRGPIVDHAGLKARLDQTRLKGIHNAENIMAALAVVHALGLNLTKAWKAICEYQPLSHRLEVVGLVDGVEFVNDSKATNLDAMEKAIDSFQQPVILIAGGKDKGFDFTSAAPLIHKKVKSCILIGEMREQIFQAWKDAASCVFADSLEEAVQMAARLGKKGDVVLLSPACSSYDMFENYEERGEVFRRAVQQLQQPKTPNTLN
jgi:UDP-N-acetylmuramoylalanine--D-glutamate ligase